MAYIDYLKDWKLNNSLQSPTFFDEFYKQYNKNFSLEKIDNVTPYHYPALLNITDDILTDIGENDLPTYNKAVHAYNQGIQKYDLDIYTVLYRSCFILLLVAFYALVTIRKWNRLKETVPYNEMENIENGSGSNNTNIVQNSNNECKFYFYLNKQEILSFLRFCWQ